MDHLAEAKKLISPPSAEGMEWARLSVQMAAVHVLIAICERLPRPAETWSECHARLREEDTE